MEDIEHILSCSICIEIFEKPRQLPCQHTFCEKCLSDYISSNTKNKPKTKPCFVCPLCRAVTVLRKQPFNGSEFPANMTIQSLLDSKELMKAIEKKKLPKVRDTAPGVMSKIKKKLFTRTKSSQTDIEEASSQIKLNRLADPSKKMRLKENEPITIENEFSPQYFTFLNVPNLYQIVVHKLTGPLFSLESSVLRKMMIIVLSIFSGMMYLLLALFAFVFEWESIFINISVLAVLVQLIFVRLKCDITMIRNRLFALAGFSMTYVITVNMLCSVFWMLAVNACDFVLYQKYGFRLVEKSIFTTGGLVNVLVRQFNTSVDIHSESNQIERKYLLTDFVIYTNAFCRESLSDMYRLIQSQRSWFGIIILVSLISLVKLCVKSVWSFVKERKNLLRRRNHIHVVPARHRR